MEAMVTFSLCCNLELGGTFKSLEHPSLNEEPSNEHPLGTASHDNHFQRETIKNHFVLYDPPCS